MSFLVDDNFPMNPKVVALLDSERADRGEARYRALSLWTLAGAHCKRSRSRDGVITVGQAKMLLNCNARRAREAADALVACGLWVACGDGFAFHEWTYWQAPKKSHVEAGQTPSSGQVDVEQTSCSGQVDATWTASRGQVEGTQKPGTNQTDADEAPTVPSDSADLQNALTGVRTRAGIPLPSPSPIPDPLGESESTRAPGGQTPRPKPRDPMRDAFRRHAPAPSDRVTCDDVAAVFSQMRHEAGGGKFKPTSRDDSRLLAAADFANETGTDRESRLRCLQILLTGGMADEGAKRAEWPFAYVVGDVGKAYAVGLRLTGSAPVASPTSDPLSLAKAAYAVACERVRASEGTGDYDDAVDAKRAAQRAMHAAEVAA